MPRKFYKGPAQGRCGLTAVIHRMFDNNRNFDANGWLVLGLNGHQPTIADSYTSSGSLYLATLGFLPLGLPASNPFWSDPRPTGRPEKHGTASR